MGLRGVLCLEDHAERGDPSLLFPSETPGWRGLPSVPEDETHKPLPLSTHLVTTAILTPKTPVCFREGILFKLNSLLVNLTESFTSICRGKQGA